MAISVHKVHSVFLKQKQECYCTLSSRLCFERWLLHANDTLFKEQDTTLELHPSVLSVCG